MFSRHNLNSDKGYQETACLNINSYQNFEDIN